MHSLLITRKVEVPNTRPFVKTWTLLMLMLLLLLAGIRGMLMRDVVIVLLVVRSGVWD